MSTLLERLGGCDALLTAVEIMYTHVTTDERLAPIFEGVHVMRLVKHQHMFLKIAFDAADHDDSARMVKAHARLIRDKGLTCEHFDVMMSHLAEALTEISDSPTDIAEAIGRMDKYRAFFPGGCASRPPASEAA